MRLYSLHYCSTSPRHGVERDRFKHMKRLSVVPELMGRHLMPLGNRGFLIQLDLSKAVSDLSQASGF